MCSGEKDICNLADVSEGGGENLRGKIVELQIVGDLPYEFGSRCVQIVDSVDIGGEEAGAVFGGENGLRRGMDCGGREIYAFLFEKRHCLEASQCNGHFHVEIA